MILDVIVRRNAEALTGHLPEYQELLDLFAESPGLVVVAADPWSGTSALLTIATETLDGTYVRCDARPCSDSIDLAMAIADAAVANLAADAASWWMGTAPPASVAGLRLSRVLSPTGIELDGLKHRAGTGAGLLSDAIELLVTLDAEAALVIDHLGLMLSAMTAAEARELLGGLRAARQRHPTLDLVLAEHSEGPMSKALTDSDHPMFRAGQLVQIRRPAPIQFVGDYDRIRTPSDPPVEMLGGAAELAAGVPALTWRIIELAPAEDGAFDGWRRLRHATAGSIERQWDLLRRVHPLAQPVVAAMGVGLRPHSVVANAKSINDALNRLRGLGIAWQPGERRWSLSDPLLRSWVRDNAPPWAVRRRRSG